MNTFNTSFVGAVPENYDRYLGPLIFEPYAIDLISRINKSNIKTVLEIACGTGRATKHLRNSLPESVKIIATDINEDMINIGKRVLKGANIEWMVADAQSLPFEDNSFELIVCQFGYMFVPDKPKAFKEAYRVLKPGGSLLSNTWDKIENIKLFSIANKILTKFFDNNPPEFYKIPFSMFDENELRKYLVDAGFKNIKVELVKKEGVSESADSATKGLIEGNPIYVEIMQKKPGDLSEILKSTREEIGKELGNNPVRCPLFAWVSEASK